MLLEPIETEKLLPISLYFDSKEQVRTLLSVILILIIIIIIVIIIIKVLLMIIMIMIMVMVMYCSKNEQECIISFKKLDASPRAFKRDNTRLRVFL